MFSPVQDSLSFWGTVMQGDPNQSQGILYKQTLLC